MPVLELADEPGGRSGFEIMKPKDNIFASLAMSLVLHACVLAYAAFPRSARNDRIAPALQRGESAVNLTFVSVRQIEKPSSPEPVRIIRADVRPEPEPETPVIAAEETEIPPDAPIERAASAAPEQEKGHEPEQAERSDADLLTKGVLAAALPASEIRPYYPLGSRMRGEEGAVTLDVLVVPPGLAREVSVVESSGYPALDRAAVKAAQSARFIVAGRQQIFAESQATLVFRFQLVD